MSEENQPVVNTSTQPVVEEKLPGTNAELIAKLEAQKATLANEKHASDIAAQQARAELSKLQKELSEREAAELKSKEDFKELYERESRARQMMEERIKEDAIKHTLVTELQKRNAVDAEMAAEYLIAKNGDKLQYHEGTVLGALEAVENLVASKPAIFKKEELAAVLPNINPAMRPTGNPGMMPPADTSTTPFDARKGDLKATHQAYDELVSRMKNDRRSGI